MPAPNTDILGSWTIQDSTNESTYPDGNVAAIVFNEANQKYQLTWTTEAEHTYTMHQLAYSEPDGVPTIQGTLLPNEDPFCATFQLTSDSPPELSANIVPGACAEASARDAYLAPEFTEGGGLAGTWSSNDKG